MKRRCGWLIVALHLLLVSLLPFSYCHAIEESNPGGFYCVELCEHDDENIDSTLVQPNLQSHKEHEHRHLHFLAEIFHFGSDRKRLLPAPAKPVTVLFTRSSMPHPLFFRESVEDLPPPPLIGRLIEPSFKRVSGSSPPVRPAIV